MPERMIPNLVETYNDLTHSVDRLVASNDRRERRNLLVYSLLTILLIVAIVVPLYIRHLGAGSREGIARITDCTTEGGQCFEESAARNAAAVALLAQRNAQANLELAVCMKTTDTERALRNCAAANVTPLQSTEQ